MIERFLSWFKKDNRPDILKYPKKYPGAFFDACRYAHQEATIRPVKKTVAVLCKDFEQFQRYVISHKFYYLNHSERYGMIEEGTIKLQCILTSNPDQIQSCSFDAIMILDFNNEAMKILRPATVYSEGF